MTRVLVTGSTGGLGANLAAMLIERGFEVVGLRRSTSPPDAVEGLAMSFVTGDILDPTSLRAALEGVDWVFHAAAIADDWHYAPEVVYRTNVEGTRNVLDAALAAGVQRFVLTSSAAALGVPRPGRLMMDERDRFNLDPAQFAYGHSKQLAEDVLAEYVDRGLQAVSVLPTALVGPCDVKFISGELIIRALKRQVFPFPSGGLNYLDMRDAADAHIAAAERSQPGERYVLAGHNLTHREALQTIGNVLNVPVKIVPVPHAVLPVMSRVVRAVRLAGLDVPVEEGRITLSGEAMYFDNGKAVRELGLTVRPFADSVRDATLWYAEHGYLEKRGVARPATLLFN